MNNEEVTQEEQAEAVQAEVTETVEAAAEVQAEAVQAVEPEAKFDSYVEALSYFAVKAEETADFKKPYVVNAIAKLKQALNELKGE